MAMKRTTVDGRTLNQRTADMLALWQFNALKDFYVVQGSYNKGGVSQSAGTHDGGGALDISVYGWSDEFTRFVEKQGRYAGFAAYYRSTIPGLWNEHIHAIAVGDPELSSGARSQVKDYYAGKNALANHGPDTGPKVPKKVYPNVTLKKVSLLAIRTQFVAKKNKYSLSVHRMQWVLREKGYNVTPDGFCGPQTRAAFVRYNKTLAKKGVRQDNTPGRVALRELGKGRFTVSVATYDAWYKKHKAAVKAAANKAKQAAAEKAKPTFAKK